MPTPAADLDETATPPILTTTIGSWPPLAWLTPSPGEEALLDASAVVIHTQQRLGIDLPTDGELYRQDPDHPDTNGMIDYFVRPLGGVRTTIGRKDREAFRRFEPMHFRAKPAGVVTGPIHEGSLDLPLASARSWAVAGGPLKFTVTSPYMLARTLIDDHYPDLAARTHAIAEVLATQVSRLQCTCLQIDEVNIPGNPADAELACAAINKVLDAFVGHRAVYVGFGNYGGQVIQRGQYRDLLPFLNGLQADHVLLEAADRPAEDLNALRELDPRIELGLGVIDVRVNRIETPDDVARRIEAASHAVGDERIRWIHPDCGLWMLRRSVVERKLAAMVAGRDRYAGS